MVATRRAVARVMAALVGLAPLVSGAEEPAAEQRAAIVALFEEAGRLMAASKAAEACPKLEAARRLDPSALGVMMRLAACYEATDQLASARAQYLEAVAVARRLRDAREATAADRASALAPRVSHLVVRVEQPPSEPTFAVELDGKVLLAEQWGVPTAVNHGSRVVSASLGGRRLWSAPVTVPREPVTLEVLVPPLAERVDALLQAEAAELGSAQPKRDGPTHGGAPRGSADAGGERGPVHAEAQRIAGWVTGGVGLAATGVGLGFLARALSAAEQSGDHCNVEDYCDEEGLALRLDAIDARTFGLAVGLSGLAVVGVGAALVLTAPEKPVETLALGLGPNGVSLTGRF